MRKRTRLTDPLQSCDGEEEEWRDWANLPAVLIDYIACRLLRYDMAEYLRLRAACKDWRKCTADPREGGGLYSCFRPRHWIMLSHSSDGVRRQFLNSATGACVHVNLPELSGHHHECSTEGLLLLRDKASGAIWLLNPLTRFLTDLPSLTTDLGKMYLAWNKLGATGFRVVHSGISDETSPATVILFIRGAVSGIAYAKPSDERWALMDEKAWKPLVEGRIVRYVRYESVLTLQGRVYLATLDGNILEVRLHPKPGLVPVVMNQPYDVVNVVSYLVPANDHQRMFMVRYHYNLEHLNDAERRRIRRRKRVNSEVIKVEISGLPHGRRYLWRIIQVFEVDLAEKRLVRVMHIGSRALFVGDAGCLSLCTKRFPSVVGNAVYPGVNSLCSRIVGVHYFVDGDKKSIDDPPFEFALEDGSRAPVLRGQLFRPGQKIVPLVRPCTLHEYLVAYAGVKGGLSDCTTQIDHHPGGFRHQVSYSKYTQCDSVFLMYYACRNVNL